MINIVTFQVNIAVNLKSGLPTYIRSIRSSYIIYKTESLYCYLHTIKWLYQEFTIT